MYYLKIQTSLLLAFSILHLPLVPGKIKLQLVDETSQVTQKKLITGGDRKGNAGITLNYTNLLLTKRQFDELASKKRHNELSADADKKDGDADEKKSLVFQFNYASAEYPYPTLRAYPTKVKGKKLVFGIPLNLSFAEVKPKPDLSVCGEQVTGDLKIGFDDMELLKQESNPKNPEEYQYFLFTPKYDAFNQHVYFEISVFPSTNPDLLPKSRALKPSPPFQS